MIKYAWKGGGQVAYIREYKKIFRSALDALDNGDLTRGDLIDAVVYDFALSSEELANRDFNGKHATLRSLIGSVLSDMESKGVLTLCEDGVYKRVTEKFIAIRDEECEEEILRIVKASPKTKQEIKDGLVGFFGTDRTTTVRDDNKLFTYMGQILKRLVSDGTFEFDGSVYSVSPEKSAYIKNRTEVLALKSTFLSRIHSKGGEFFEHYFLNLLKKYLTQTGKTVTEGYVTGGSDDGGIDGIIRTVDSLGFRETIMIQMKNRSDCTTETTVRGFYGAVCARQGSRGVFATISEFHPMAERLLDTIDNCVGVDGDKIFSMACDTSYGIIREGSRIKIDNEVI